MPIQINPITEPDIPGAVTCIQRAFAGDPYNAWVFDAKNFSTERNAVSLGLRCKWGMKHALFNVAKDTSDPSGKVLGVSCWLPPRPANQSQSWSEWFGGWWLWFSQVGMNLWYGRGGLNVKRYWIWKAAQAEAQREIWTDRKGYYFCNIVTVLPEAQGRGIGRLLFQDVTAVADEEGRKCYLESSRKEPNMAIYEKMGFELRKEMVCDDDGEKIKLYCMVRKPEDEDDLESGRRVRKPGDEGGLRNGGSARKPGNGSDLESGGRSRRPAGDVDRRDGGKAQKSGNEDDVRNGGKAGQSGDQDDLGSGGRSRKPGGEEDLRSGGSTGKPGDGNDLTKGGKTRKSKKSEDEDGLLSGEGTQESGEEDDLQARDDIEAGEDPEGGEGEPLWS